VYYSVNAFVLQLLSTAVVVVDIHETVSRASRGWGGALASHAGGATTTDEDAAARSPPRLSRGDAFIS